MTTANDILDFWFGELDHRGCASDEKVRRWWTKSDDFDRELEDRFGKLRREMLAGAHEDWLEDPDSLIAYIVVLDQFSRNIGRGTPVMYEADQRALAATKRALDAGLHRMMATSFRVALYMPLMHSESLADQDMCIGLFQELAAQRRDVDRLGQNVEFAIKHRDIVQRFGRFPHRNEILGRESTPEELEFLQQPGSSF